MSIYVIPTDTCMGLACRLDNTSGYEEIYDLKGREYQKPLAILVPTWEDLAYESTLSPAQINFLKTYKFPFTVIAGIREDFRDEYPILDEKGYTTVGFRVAEACLPRETQGYIRMPFFMTSANISGEKECQTIDEVKEVFRDNFDTFKILPGTAGNQPASNIIQFVGTTNDLKYARKNYPLSSK